MDELEQLVACVVSSRKCGKVCAEVIRNVGARELAARRSLKDAVKATKNKLHQVGAAYLDAGIDYSRWERQLWVAADSSDPAQLRRACAEWMHGHSSTRERLPILEAFYAETLQGLPPLRTVLDLACGLNPLALPWMGLPQGVRYYAYDMYLDMAEFLNRFFERVGVQGEAVACDVACAPPTRRADLALLLKTLPCLEQLDRSASARLLDGLKADYLLVSFPVRSLGGRDKRMTENYEAHFLELVAGKPWEVRRFVFSTELAFLVHKR
jgi:16S rRNA (guanine(1405)-N(7))-methyltransferase